MGCVSIPGACVAAVGLGKEQHQNLVLVLRTGSLDTCARVVLIG